MDEPVPPTECAHPDFAWCVVCHPADWSSRTVPLEKR